MIDPPEPIESEKKSKKDLVHKYAAQLGIHSSDKSLENIKEELKKVTWKK